MTLDAYLVRCQRNALWSALPLASLAAFSAVVAQRAEPGPGLLDQFIALTPLACVLVVLTFRLSANADDVIQHIVAIGASLLGMTSIAMIVISALSSALVVPGGVYGMYAWAALFGALAPAAWSLLAALIPCRPRETGRLAWWRLVLIVVLVVVLPALPVLSSPSNGDVVFLLVLTAPVAFALACARSGCALPMIVGSACMGAFVGGVLDYRTDLVGVPTWTVEFALLYALGGAAAYMGGRARGMTAVRQLDGEPVRLRPPVTNRPPQSGSRLVWTVVALGSALWLAVSAIVKRSRMPSTESDPVDRATMAVAVLAISVDQRGCGAHGPAVTPRPGITDGETTTGKNAGIEAVFAAVNILDELSDPLHGDTDGDGREEFIDPWGNPYVYFAAADYAAAANGRDYVRRDGTHVSAKPRLHAAKGEFWHPASFQVFSLGPDGEPGTSDDIFDNR